MSGGITRMRYYIRKRGKDEVQGPFTMEEVESALKAGTILPSYMAMRDEGQSPDQLRNHWDYEWFAVGSGLGLEHCLQASHSEPGTAAPNASTRSTLEPTAKSSIVPM